MHKLSHTLDEMLHCIQEAGRFSIKHKKLLPFAVLASFLFTGSFLSQAIFVGTNQNTSLLFRELAPSVDGVSYLLNFTGRLIQALSGQGILFAIAIGILFLTFIAISLLGVYVTFHASEVGTKKRLHLKNHLPGKRAFFDIATIVISSQILLTLLAVAAGSALTLTTALPSAAAGFLNFFVFLLSLLLSYSILIPATFMIIEVVRGKTALRSAAASAFRVALKQPLHVFEYGILLLIAQTSISLLAYFALILAGFAIAFIAIILQGLGAAMFSAFLIFAALTFFAITLLFLGVLTLFTYRSWTLYYERIKESSFLSITRHIITMIQKTRHG
jgi:hypothetical protein